MFLDILLAFGKIQKLRLVFLQCNKIICILFKSKIDSTLF